MIGKSIIAINAYVVFTIYIIINAPMNIVASLIDSVTCIVANLRTVSTSPVQRWISSPVGVLPKYFIGRCCRWLNNRSRSFFMAFSVDAADIVLDESIVTPLSNAIIRKITPR